MTRVALTLAALGALGLAADRALAEGALSYPMAAHVAAKYGIQHPGLPAKVQQHYAREYYRKHRGYPGYPYGPGFVRPPIRRHPAVVVPFPGHPPVLRPPVYRQPRYYYYGPYRGLRYYGPGISIGIGF